MIGTGGTIACKQETKKLLIQSGKPAKSKGVKDEIP